MIATYEVYSVEWSCIGVTLNVSEMFCVNECCCTETVECNCVAMTQKLNLYFVIGESSLDSDLILSISIEKYDLNVISLMTMRACFLI